MNKLDAGDVIGFLEEEAKRLFDDGVFHQDEYGRYSVGQEESEALEAAAEVLRALYLNAEDDND